MHKILSKIIVSLCFIYTLTSLAAESRDDREIIMAESAIFTTFIIDTNSKSQYLCTQNDYACLGADKSDLGLALIAAKNSTHALSSLANLSRYKLDGGLSEDYTCYVLNKGKKLEPFFKKIKSDLLIGKCNTEVANFMQKNKKIFDETQQPNICADENVIRERVKYLLMDIKSGKKCSSENF